MTDVIETTTAIEMHDKPNADLAYRILDAIAAHPEHFNMNHWASHGYRCTRGPGEQCEVGLDDLTATVAEGSCGTTACFAGWAVVLSGHKIIDGATVFTADERLTVQEAADRLLGITWDDSEHLFYVSESEIADEVEDLFGPRPSQP